MPTDTPAPCLLDLRRQLEVEAAPHAPWYHGIMGDWRHMLRRSPHNQGNAIDVSTVLLGLFRCNQVVETLRYDAAHGHEVRVRRIIWARRSCSAATRWQWVRYWGLNPHELHAHIEIHARERDNRRRWRIR